MAIKVISIKRLGLTGLVQFKADGKVKTEGFDPRLKDDELIALLEEKYAGGKGSGDNSAMTEAEAIALRTRGKELKIKGAHNMGLGKLKAAIKAAEKDAVE